jgi:hypothetical protein
MNIISKVKPNFYWYIKQHCEHIGEGMFLYVGEINGSLIISEKYERTDYCYASSDPITYTYPRYGAY